MFSDSAFLKAVNTRVRVHTNTRIFDRTEKLRGGKYKGQRELQHCFIACDASHNSWGSWAQTWVLEPGNICTQMGMRHQIGEKLELELGSLYVVMCAFNKSVPQLPFSF